MPPTIRSCPHAQCANVHDTRRGRKTETKAAATRYDKNSRMPAKAQALCEQQQWRNVELAQNDAAEYVAPEPLDGVLFGLSYNTMPHHLMVLRHALKQLRSGGRIVIMDGKVPSGPGGKLAL